MPRPDVIPEKLAIGSILSPTSRSVMFSRNGEIVENVAEFCEEREVHLFRIVGHEPEFITVDSLGFLFQIPWQVAIFDWDLGSIQRIDPRSEPSTWVNKEQRPRIGSYLRYIGEGSLQVTSEGPVSLLSTRMTGRFRVVNNSAQSITVELEEIRGKFKILVDDSFTTNWAQVSASHKPDDRIATFLQPGRRIIPRDIGGNPVEGLSYLIIASPDNRGVMLIAPLMDNDFPGPTLSMPSANSLNLWMLAPDDPSKIQLQAGMKIIRYGSEHLVTHVDRVTKEVTLHYTEQRKMQLGEVGYTIVHQDIPKVSSETNRFERLDEEDNA